MPKLDLVNAQQIKSAAGEWLQAKGQGWSWSKPAAPVGGWAVVGGTSGIVDVLGYTDADGAWRAYRFRGSGAVVFSQAGEVEYLIVAGGGAGAQQAGGGGGGGAGGLLAGVASIAAGESPVVVGAGGSGFYPGTTDGLRGENSSFAGFVAVGGGGGLASTQANIDAAIGGSGGGLRWGYIGSTGGVDGQGFRGSGGFSGTRRAGGSGGGAGGEGIAPEETTAGRGGPGKLSTITGDGVYYAGGGGGSANAGPAALGGVGGGANGLTNNGIGLSGLPNTGGGGGGSRNTTSGAGGSGVVIIRVRV